MSDSQELPGLKWQPFTPRGVAGAAGAPRWHLWLALSLTAVLSISVLWLLLDRCWTPVIDEAIAQLPENGYIRDGVYYPGSFSSDMLLAENAWLAIAIQWSPEAVSNQASDVRITMQIDRVRICSILGCTVIAYDLLGDRSLGRADSESWWRAWRPFLLVAAALLHLIWLLVAWWVLTLAYSLVVRFLAFYRDRHVDFPGACRVAQAALIPGALWLILSVYLYQNGWMDIFSLLVVFIFHVPVAWVYLSLSIRHLPPLPDVNRGNPFGTENDNDESGPAKNPFAEGT